MGNFVSIVILTTKDPKRVLDCLWNQTYKYFEVIIASEEGIVNAMNKALEKAKGDIFVRIDDDVSIPVDWLENLLKPFFNPNVAGVTGPTFVPAYLRENRDSIKAMENPNWFLRWISDNEFKPAGIRKCGMVSYDSNYEERFVGYQGHHCDHLEGTNWAMRTELIRKVGGFDPKFDGVAEWFDADVEFKIKKLGYSLHYNSSAYLWHLLEKGVHYPERFEGFGRLKNWLRFHKRHSKFHPKLIVGFLIMGGYLICQQIKRIKRQIKKYWKYFLMLN